MSNTPLVSVIISNYNYGRYLEGLFEALSGQTLGAHAMEVLMVDDKSTDNSMDVIRRWEKTHPFHCFKVIEDKRHLGHPALVRNKGFSRASAERMLYIDADDEPAPVFLEKMYAALDQGFDLAYTGNLCQHPGGVNETILPPFDANLLRTQNIVTSTAMMIRQVWERSGGFRANTAYEDWDFWVRAAMNGFRFKRIAEALLLYRVHDANFSYKAVKEDASSKAAIVMNNRQFFSNGTVRWGRALQSDVPWARPFPRGVIPTEEQVQFLKS